MDFSDGFVMKKVRRETAEVGTLAAAHVSKTARRGGTRHPAAILKSGTRGERFFRGRQFIPFLFARNIFLGTKFRAQNRKKGEN
jgi:hypothetical protein